MTNAKRIGTLMFRYIRNELSKKEKAELDNWRSHSPINERIFQESIDPERIRTDLIALEASRIRRLEQSPNAYAVPKPASRFSIRRIGIRIIKVAASVLFLFSTYVGVTIYRFATAHSHPARDSEDQLAAVIDFSDLTERDDFNRGILAGYAQIKIQEEPNGWLTGIIPKTTEMEKHVYFRLFTSEGNHLLLNFPDSTRIWLNSKATIKYPSWQGGDSIRIFLSGEAYVHIPYGSKHIYEIKISPPVDSTKPSAFREAVLDKVSRSMYLFSGGGDFYLKAYFGNDATTATLISGSLRIDSAAGKFISPINLEPGQQVRLDSGNLKTLKPEHVGELYKWKTH